MKVELTFTEALLGSQPGDPDVAREFILSKAPTEDLPADEVETLPDKEEMLSKGSTVFAKVDGNPFLYDYVLKGYFKKCVQAVFQSGVVTQAELKALRLTQYTYKSTIDLQVFVTPRRIMLDMPEGTQLGWLERPLRADTMRGPRIALARSESAPAGTKIRLEIVSLAPRLNELVPKWLDFGTLSGLGQWFNGGWGKFSWQRLSD